MTATLPYILPHKFLNTEYGEPLRSLITKNRQLQHVVHFGNQQVFPGATNYVCLLFLAKAGTLGCRWVRANNLQDWLETKSGEEQWLPAEGLSAREWTFAGAQFDDLLWRIQNRGRRLLDLPADMSRGSSTGDDGVFIVDKDSVRVEKDLLLIPVFATDFNRYRFAANSKKRIIFPYKQVDDGFELIPENELRTSFPKAYEYLSTHKGRLKRRAAARAWYAFSAPRNLKLHASAQILIPLLAEKGSFAAIPDGMAPKLCPMASGGFTLAVGSSAFAPEYWESAIILGLLPTGFTFSRSIAREAVCSSRNSATNRRPTLRPAPARWISLLIASVSS